MSTVRKPATILVKKKPNQWQNSAAQVTARTVYVDDTQQQQTDNNYQALMTRNIFLDTIDLNLHHSSLKGTLKGSVPSTEDYRYNLHTSQMALASEERYQLPQQSKLSVKVKQTISSSPPERDSNLRATAQSIQSITTSQVPSSSKGILPTLNESPSNLRQAEDPSKQMKIKDQLEMSRFEDKQVLSGQKKQSKLDAAVRRHITLQSKLLTKDIVDSSVTLGTHRRKVQLPALSSTKHNRHNTMVQMTSLEKEGNHTLDISRRLKANYESNHMKTLVNEQTILGRQSVRNLLQIYTPGVSKQLPALQQMQTPQHASSIIIPRSDARQSRFANLTSQDFSSVRNSLQLLNMPIQSTKFNNLRNSEAYNLLRSTQPQPVKRRRQNELNIIDQGFNKTQMVEATQMSKKTLNHSVSPTNFDTTMSTGLGYAPLTTRLFNRGRHKKKNQSNYHETGIKFSLAAAKLQLQSTTAMPMRGNVDTSSLASLNASQSSFMPVECTSDPGQHPQPVTYSNKQRQSSKHINLQVENKKDWAPTELLCRSQVYSQRSLVVETVTDNKIEAERNDVQMQYLQYLQSTPKLQQSPPQRIAPVIKEKLRNKLNQSQVMLKNQSSIYQNNLQEFIKVSNMVLETKTLNQTDDCGHTDESAYLQTSQSIIGSENEVGTAKMKTEQVKEHVTKTLPPYGMLPNTQHSPGQKPLINACEVNLKRRSQNTVITDQDQYDDMANQATQIIQEENFENISLQNDEEWGAEVDKIMLSQMRKNGQQLPVKGSDKLINAIVSARQAPANAEEANQIVMTQTMRSFKKEKAYKSQMPPPPADTVPPPVSSASTMHLQQSHLRSSQKGLLTQKMEETSSPLRSDYSSPVKNKNSNNDISRVLTNKIVLKNDLGTPHATASNFKPVFSVKACEFNKSQVIITGEVSTKPLQKDRFHLKEHDSQFQIRDARLKATPQRGEDLSVNLNEREMPEASVHNESNSQLMREEAAKHPTLVDALHKSKLLRIPGPIRKLSKSRAKLLIPRALADFEALIPSIIPVSRNQGKPQQIQSQYLQVSQDEDTPSKKVLIRDADSLYKPSRLEDNSLLEAREESDRTSIVDISPLMKIKIPVNDQIQDPQSTPRLRAIKNENIFIIKNQLSDLPVARSSSRLSSSMRQQLESLVTPDELYLQQSTTMKEILPINLQFSPQKQGKLLKHKRRQVNHSSKKISLLNDMSAKSISKERSKKVNFSKTVQQPLNEQNKINSDTDPVMHIQQMVWTDRYSKWPSTARNNVEEKEGGGEGIDQDLNIIQRGPSKLEIKVQGDDGSVNQHASRKEIIYKNSTQMLGELKEAVSVRDISTKKEKYSEKLNKSQVDAQTLGNESPEELKMEDLSQLKLNNSKVKVSLFRRTQEKFTQKLQTKMMIINPLRTRQHTSQHKDTHWWSNEKQFLAKQNASTFIENPPSVQQQLNAVSIGNLGGMFVSTLISSKESPMPAPTGLQINRINDSSDLEHIAQVVISSQSKMNECYASNYPLIQKKPKLQKQQRFAPTMNFRSAKEESEDLPIGQMNLTGETLINPNANPGYSSHTTQTNRILAAKLRRNIRPDGHTSSTKMLIISSPGQLEQLEQLGLTAHLSSAFQPSRATLHQRQGTSSPSTPASFEPVQQLLLLDDQMNITPATYGLSNHGSAEDLKYTAYP